MSCPTYVKKFGLDDVVVFTNDKSIVALLLKMGFGHVGTNDLFFLGVKSENEKANVFEKLRGLDIPFMGGVAWSPAEVFEYLRDDLNLISGSFKKIVWLEPGKTKIEIA